MEASVESTLGVLLAGAHQWNDRSLDRACPRCLTPVALTPVAGYGLNWLAEGGVRDAVICANSASGVATRVLGDGRRYGVRLDYHRDEIPRGPAGCLRDALLRTDARRVIVADAALLPSFSAGKLLATHALSGAAMTVVLSSHNLDAAADRRLRPAGAYVIERDALEAVSARGYQDIKEELIPQLRRAGRAVLPYVTHERVFRVAGLHAYLAMQEQVVEQIAAGRLQARDFERVGGSVVHKAADVSPASRLIGPCLVAAHARVRAGAVIIGPTVVGEHADIGENAVVSRSAVWDGAVVERRARVDGTVVAFAGVVRAGEHLAGGLRFAARLRLPGGDTPIWARRVPAMAATRRSEAQELPV